MKREEEHQVACFSSGALCHSIFSSEGGCASVESHGGA